MAKRRPFNPHCGDIDDWEEGCKPKVPPNRRYVWGNRARVIIHPNKRTLWDAYQYYYDGDEPPEGVRVDLQAFWVVLYEKVENGETWETFNVHIRAARSLGSWEEFYCVLGHEMTHYLELMEDNKEDGIIRKDMPLYGDENMYAMRKEGSGSERPVPAV